MDGNPFCWMYFGGGLRGKLTCPFLPPADNRLRRRWCFRGCTSQWPEHPHKERSLRPAHPLGQAHPLLHTATYPLGRPCIAAYTSEEKKQTRAWVSDSVKRSQTGDMLLSFHLLSLHSNWRRGLSRQELQTSSPRTWEAEAGGLWTHTKQWGKTSGS